MTSQQKALVASIANAPFALALTRSAIKRAGFWGSLKPSVYVPVIRDHKVVFGIYTVLTAVQCAYALKARRDEAPATLADPDLMRMTELAGYNHAHDLEDRCIRDRSGTCTAPKRPKNVGGLR